MSRKRKQHSEVFKAKVALEALKGIKTLSQISTMYAVHPVVISQWKKHLLAHAGEVFTRKGRDRRENVEEVTAPLYQKIGQLEMEVDWLKKKL
mgnify:CR=1 FL=1